MQGKAGQVQRRVVRWEAQSLDRGELWYSHGLFVTKAAAVQWAEQERKTIEKGGA
jgi:hypothetical protein